MEFALFFLLFLFICFSTEVEFSSRSCKDEFIKGWAERNDKIPEKIRNEMQRLIEGEDGQIKKHPLMWPSMFPNVLPKIKFYAAAENGPLVKVVQPQISEISTYLKMSGTKIRKRVTQGLWRSSHFLAVVFYKENARGKPVIPYKANGNWIMYFGDKADLHHFYGSVQLYQKLNHFPGSERTEKKELTRSIQEMHKKFPQGGFDEIMPKTFILENQYEEFIEDFNANPNAVYIVKDTTVDNGKGIFIINNIEDVAKKISSNNKNNLLAQRYLEPHLIPSRQNRKYDLRVFIHMTDIMRVHYYKRWVVRFANEPYKKGDYGNLKRHLTHNFDKKPDSYWTSEQLFEYLQKEEGMTQTDITDIENQVRDIVGKSFVALESGFWEDQKKAYGDGANRKTEHEIFAADILLTKREAPKRGMKAWLLEINSSPALGPEDNNEVQSSIHYEMLMDSFNMAGIEVPLTASDYQNSLNYRTKNYDCLKSKEHITKETERIADVRRYVNNGRTGLDNLKVTMLLTPSDVRELIAFEDLDAKKGNFVLAFPLKDSIPYIYQYNPYLLARWQMEYHVSDAKHMEGIERLQTECKAGNHLKDSKGKVFGD